MLCHQGAICVRYGDMSAKRGKVFDGVLFGRLCGRPLTQQFKNNHRPWCLVVPTGVF